MKATSVTNIILTVLYLAKPGTCDVMLESGTKPACGSQCVSRAVLDSVLLDLPSACHVTIHRCLLQHSPSTRAHALHGDLCLAVTGIQTCASHSCNNTDLSHLANVVCQTGSVARVLNAMEVLPLQCIHSVRECMGELLEEIPPHLITDIPGDYCKLLMYQGRGRACAVERGNCEVLDFMKITEACQENVSSVVKGARVDFGERELYNQTETTDVILTDGVHRQNSSVEDNFGDDGYSRSLDNAEATHDLNLTVNVDQSEARVGVSVTNKNLNVQDGKTTYRLVYENTDTHSQNTDKDTQTADNNSKNTDNESRNSDNVSSTETYSKRIHSKNTEADNKACICNSSAPPYIMAYWMCVYFLTLANIFIYF